ncbi:MAG: CoA-binding protein [Rhodospirillaceae bacterium]|jgi:acyl-CoA synthetase (NDP forming)|nr:CoA-binding protein [Rhodospirillales bacterium]MBT3908025.1 CoA-binding protein [Rhodospirillaceae bacterium]MBT5033900.1 CoA-binding protein [Rhodospirillaceae bacterium]MBT6220442.1 CoA-binding protein [Rhodospirillaceae bacterium]MBT6361653.1 CoA-binding protein [Rhodospirillaceae bacterium]
MSNSEIADALFNPRAVALVGASGDEKKNTARPQRFLKKHGFKGRIVPINPSRDEVLGEAAYPDIASAPGPIDHAFIMVPAKFVPGVIEDCVKAGVKTAAIYSDGFAETGEGGRRIQEDMVKMARDGGLRIIGPNSMGAIDVGAGAAITVNAALEVPEIKPGSLGVVSQSGTILGTLISRGTARGQKFSRLVSIGNEADLTVGEVGDMLVDDPNTGAILLFLETIRDPVSLAAMARRAYETGKPVIAYKLGRSEAGRELALSHSGALAGDDRAADAFFRQHGVLRVGMLETLFELPALVMGRKPMTGKRVGVLTTTGGGAATVVDQLGAKGIELISAPAPLREKLKPFGINFGDETIVDVTMAGTRKEVYQPALQELLDTPDCDAVVAVVGSSAQFHAHAAVEPIVAAASGSKKPVAVFLVPQADQSLALLADAGIAAFRTPEACADAVSCFLDWTPPSPIPTNVLPGAVIEQLAAAKGPILDEMLSGEIFEALGIGRAVSHLLDEDNPVSKVGYPVVAKAVSPDIAHKTEAGGVILNIQNDAELEKASKTLRTRLAASHPQANLKGILVQRMEQGLGEVLIGYRQAGETGPIVTLALGGTLAEIYKDASVRLAPVDEKSAMEMIEEVKGLAPLRGYRGMPKGDLDALASALVKISALAAAPEVSEAEINPLIVKPEGEGIVAVDGLIVLYK